MTNTSNETSQNGTANVEPVFVASGQPQAETPDLGAPTPVDDLAKRIKILRENGCRAYKDGRLELVFEAKPRAQLSLAELALAQRGAADSGVTP